jgi:hypothetical protein
MTLTFLLVHKNGIGEPMVVEYESREGAEEAAQHLAKTQGGLTTVYAALELASLWRGRDLIDGVPPFDMEPRS